MIKLISWNVNGLRACIDKGFTEYFKNADADVFCIQETKLQEGQVSLEFEGYRQYWNYAAKKGYSGTAIFSKLEPIRVSYGIGIAVHDQEGRVITLETDRFFVVTVYTPNSKRGLERLGYRLTWEDAFQQYLKNLDREKPVIVCGDMNVAHREIDLKHPSSNRKNSGFTQEERDKFTNLLNTGFVDTFRHVYPDQKDAYTWWSYMFNAREKNVGWRIDYFCVSERLKDSIVSVAIHPEVQGSDHCPVELVVE